MATYALRSTTSKHLILSSCRTIVDEILLAHRPSRVRRIYCQAPNRISLTLDDTRIAAVDRTNILVLLFFVLVRETRCCLTAQSLGEGSRDQGREQGRTRVSLAHVESLPKVIKLMYDRYTAAPIILDCPFFFVTL